jgi:hypothetical protein
MRYILIFLVVANAIYFGWQVWWPQPTSPAISPAPRPLLNRGLTLVSEFEAQTAELTQESVVAPRVCSLVGDFPSVDEANSFLQRAAARGLPAELHLAGTPLPPHYRVLLPPASSREVATITLEGLSDRLREDNQQIDTYLITRGLLANAIALGVFSSSDNANRVRDLVSGMGYTVQVDEIPRSDGAVQVVLSAPDFTPLDEAEWLDFAGDAPGLTRSENLCETIAHGTQFP